MTRFWSKVDKGGDCWLWTAAMRPNGYGVFSTGTHRAQTHHSAHRFAFELTNGPIPEGLVVDHLCGVRACVNPAHLQAVSQRENLMRAATSMAARNAAKTHCPAGHPYDEANTHYKNGHRVCRACARAYAQRKRDKGAA